jgi:hypothetical protein
VLSLGACASAGNAIAASINKTPNHFLDMASPVFRSVVCERIPGTGQFYTQMKECQAGARDSGGDLEP